MFKAITFNRFFLCSIGVFSGYSFKSFLILLFTFDCGGNEACSACLQTCEACEASREEAILQIKILYFLVDSDIKVKFKKLGVWLESIKYKCQAINTDV